MKNSDNEDTNINDLIDKLDDVVEKKFGINTADKSSKSSSQPDAVNSETLMDEYKDSSEIVSHMREKYSKKVATLDKLKDKEKRDRAAVVFTKRRYREVIAALIKSGNALSEVVLNAKKESVKLLDKAKGKTRTHRINKEIEESLAQLGSEAYDSIVLGAQDVFKNKNILNIINKINEYNVEIELICEKFEKDISPKVK